VRQQDAALLGGDREMENTGLDHRPPVNDDALRCCCLAPEAGTASRAGGAPFALMTGA
jgi:hypothetical protein